MLVKELCYNVFTEGERHTTVIFTPTINIFVRVRPKEITEQTCIWHISWAYNTLHLVKACQFWAEATMCAEDFLVDHGSTREAVEAISESLPEFDAKPALALIIKPVDTINRGTLVVASKNEEIFRVLDFVRHQQTDGFQRLLSPINIVTKENVIRLGRESTVLKETEKVIILAMNVTTNFDRGFKLKKHWLSDEQITAAQAEHFDFCF